MSLMDRTWPRKHASKLHPVEVRLTVMTFVDNNSDHCLTVPLRGQGVELTGTSIRAIAVGEISALQMPCDVCHSPLLNRSASTKVITLSARVIAAPSGSTFEEAIERIVSNGIGSVKSTNPYWDENGVTFEDPDGYRTVLHNGAWDDQHGLLVDPKRLASSEDEA